MAAITWLASSSGLRPQITAAMPLMAAAETDGLLRGMVNPMGLGRAGTATSIP